MQNHATTPGRPVTLVQLPFPSQGNPEPTLQSYYSVYERLYREVLPTYQTNPGDLWEAPLWIAHLDGALDRDDTTLIDLSLQEAEPNTFSAQIEQRLTAPTYVLFSPLAQNFALAVHTARLLRRSGHITVLGGNMARLAQLGDFDIVFIGQADAGLYEQIQSRDTGMVGSWPRLGKSQKTNGFRPNYRLLRCFAARVSLIRVNASHGCLFGCTFCGDGWSRQLQVVPYETLEKEFDEIEETFPSINIVYIGDKTFGQSREAVENLIQANANRRRYHFIVQTHVSMIDEWLLDALDRLGVKVVELGFETADEQLLKAVRKFGGAAVYRSALARLHDRGKIVILNVLGGLPYQTEETHARTIRFLSETSHLTYLYNLYNFVPYPETPLFATLKSRIVDWDFSHWREDMPVVFEPYHLTRQRSWQLFLELVRECENLCASRASSLSSQASVIHA